MTETKKAKGKTWITRAEFTPDAERAAGDISRALGINHIVAKLLYSRGYSTPAAASAFIKVQDEVFLNPFEMAGMNEAVARIRTAIEKNERITIYGDYDVDGVTAVSTLYLYLKEKGASVDYYIPNRSGEGYGVSCSAIDVIGANGSSLIITVDTGITANDEVDYAKKLGIDFVITDHHECRSDLPNAVAVVNPHRPDCNYPFKELAGVGVVFKVISAVEEAVFCPDRLTATLNVIRSYADLISIGTIADVMPIKEENRIIVKYGLSMIEKTERTGLSALIDVASGKDPRKPDRFSKRRKKPKITSGYIGFTLAPRINAAGRVRSATVAVELFLTNDYNRAYEIAEELCDANKERQAEENKIVQEAYDKISEIDIDRYPVIVLEANDWHHGVIGIVSSRITEKYSRPSILVSFEGNEDPNLPSAVGKGSGRSIKGLNLVDALCYSSDLLAKFGGHELAAGLSVTRENLPEFIEKINEYARNNLSQEDMVPVVEADMEIPFNEINLRLAEQISLLEPFGVGNPVPMFVARGVNLVELSGVSDGKHSRLTLSMSGVSVSGMFFSNSPESLGVYSGDKVDCIFSIDINEWQDRKSVQLIIKDVKPSLSQINANDADMNRFIEIKQGAHFNADECVIPERDDFVTVFRLIQNSIHQGVDVLSHRDIVSRLSGRSEMSSISYVKLKFIFMIFTEMNVVEIDEFEEDTYRFKLHFSSTKKDLEKSGILRRLRLQLR